MKKHLPILVLLLTIPSHAHSTLYSNASTGVVGIGTTSPQSLLQVYGGEVQIGSSAAACAAANAGALRYSSGSAYVCDGSQWDVFGGSAGGKLPALTSANIWVGNASNIATGASMSGDCSLSNTAAITCTKTNGTSFGTLATQYGVNLSTQATGTLQAAQFPALTGDVTTAAGALATTVAKIQGVTVGGTTGTGNVVFAASPTFTGTVTGAASNWSGNVGIGTTAPTSPLTVNGIIESKTGGIKFPDGTIQVTASNSSSLDVQTFTSSGTWTKPGAVSANSLVHIECIGGGGGGDINIGTYEGGGGGSYKDRWVLASLLGSTETVTVGAGGNGSSSAACTGGGASSFGTWLTAYGGYCENGGAGGAGGGYFSGGGNSGLNDSPSGEGAGATSGSNAKIGNFIGGGGGIYLPSSSYGSAGGSVYGGGGGGVPGATSGGISQFAGNGGNNGAAGTAPGGGGGAGANGAAGQCKASTFF